MAEFEGEEVVAARKWKNAFDATQAEEIYDFPAMNSDEDFNDRIKVLNAYVAESEEYGEFVADMFTNLEKKMSVFGDYGPAKQALTVHKETLTTQSRQLEPAIRAHIEFGKLMVEALELLKKNRAAWSYENGELQFEDDLVLTRFNEIIEAGAKHQDIISSPLAEPTEEG